MKMHVQVIRVGRKRKQGVLRDAGGKSRGESVESVIATAMAHRLKQGLPYELCVVRDERTREVVASDAHSGHLLGQLKLLGNRDGISEKQFFTGMELCKLVTAYARIMGIPMGVKALDYGGARGTALTPDPDPVWVAGVKKRYQDCTKALSQADRSEGTGNKIQKIVRLVCLEQITLREFLVEPANLGNFRAGMNALSREFKAAPVDIVLQAI